MNEHNALKYGVSITRGVKRLFGLDDQEQGVTRLSESLSASADLWQRPEFAFPRGEFNWSVFLAQGAVAAEQSFIGIQNPAGSGILIGITEVLPQGNATVNENLCTNTAFVATGSGTPTQVDLRVPNFPNPALATKSVTLHQAASPGGATLREFQGGVGQVVPYPVRVVLLPGFTYYLTFSNAAVNNAILGSISGWERRAHPGELLTF